MNSSAFQAKLRQFNSRLRFERVLRYKYAFAVVLLFDLALITFRFYHLSVTGYLLPDEAWYYETIVLDQWRPNYRELFIAVYLLFFGSVKDFASLVSVGYVFVLIWTIGVLCVFYFLMKELRVSEPVGSLMLLSLPLIPILTLMLPFMLTETFGLFLALSGLLFTLRYVRTRDAWNALLSSVFFVLAFKVREPYLIFALGNLLTVVVAHRARLKGILSYVIPLLIVLPIPVGLRPLEFAQPFYRLAIVVYQTAQSAASSQRPIVLPSLQTLLGPTMAIPYHFELDVLRGFVLGLTLGYNPLFAAFALAAILIGVRAAFRGKRHLAHVTALWNSILGIIGFSISLFFIVYPAAGFLPAWTSSVMRMAHTSLPAFLNFRTLYDRTGSRRMVGILIVFLLLSSSQFPLLMNAAQSNLTRTGAAIDRLSLDYRAPYYRIYEIAKHSESTLVVGLNLRGVHMFLSMLPNAVAAVVPNDESGFKELLARGWESIILYDNWITLDDPYPAYYKQILLSRSYEGYLVKVLWIDGESYAFEMHKT